MDNLPILDGQVGNDYHQTLFDVVELPAPYPAGLDGNDRNTGYKFIMNKETGGIISCMTNSYKLVKNKDLMEAATQPIIDAGGILSEARIFAQRRTIYRFKFLDNKIDINGDLMTPEIEIRNSYDGTVGRNITAGAFRLICSNGMTIGRIFKELSNKHLITNKALDELDITLVEIIARTTMFLQENVQALMNTPVLKKKHILSIMTMFPQKHHEDITNYIIAQRVNTYWDLLNVATWATSHLMNRNAESTHKLDEQVFNKVLKLGNIRAEA